MFDQIKLYEHNGKEYQQYHGSPFDRGSADNYYQRPRNPHKGGVGGNSGAHTTALTLDELEAYHAGYDWNERHGGKKDYD